MRKEMKRRLSLFLAVCMVVSLFVGIPVSVFADASEISDGLFCAGPNWTDDGPAFTTTDASEETECLPKQTTILCFGTKLGASTEPYTGGLTIKKVTDEASGTVDNTADGTISPYTNQQGASVDGVYNLRFEEGAKGTYRIYSDPKNTSDYVTVKIASIDGGFYTSTAINMANYIDEQSLEYTQSKNRTFYFAYPKTQNDLNFEIVKDAGNILPEMKVEGWDYDPESIAIEQATGTSGYDIWKITLKKNFGEFWGRVGFTLNISGANDPSGPSPHTYWMDLSSKREGLVLAWPDYWDNNGEAVVDDKKIDDCMKEEGVVPTITHGLWFGMITSDEEGDKLESYTGSLTIKKVGEDGITDAATTDGTIVDHPDTTTPGVYSVRFQKNAYGDYRVYAGNTDSFVTLHVGDIVAGFYSSADISNATFIDGQELTFSESKNREFYFAFQMKTEDGVTCSLAASETTSEGTVTFPLTNGNASGVTTSKEPDSNGYEVYKVTLGEDFEALWENEYDLEFAVQMTDGSNSWVERYHISLHDQREGLVCAWPDWGDEGPVYTSKPTHEEWWKYLALEYTEVLYFGKMDASGNVTPIRNASDITITCEDDLGGAKLEPYEDGCPGYYEVILPDYDKTYTFTSGDSTVRIQRDRPSFAFFSNEDCTEELGDAFVVSDTNKDFYFTLPEFNPADEIYDYIAVIGTNLASGDAKNYYVKAYNGSTGAPIQYAGADAPITITPISGAESNTEAKKYQVTVDKAKAPAKLEVTVKAHKKNLRSNEMEDMENTISVCNLQVESDPESTFTGGASDNEKVTIDEAPDPADLVVDAGSSESGLTEEQQEAIASGGSISVSIKADAITVDENGTVTTPPSSATTDEEKAQLQDAVTDIKRLTASTWPMQRPKTTFLDISIKAIVTPAEDAPNREPIETPITKTKNALTIRIPIPTSILGPATRYTVVRYHDHTFDILRATRVGDDLIFDTDRFSTYAIVSRDPNALETALVAGGKNISDLTWKNSGENTFTYDGKSHTCPVTVDGLIEGCTVTYTGNTATAAGTYQVKVASVSYGGVTYQASGLDLPETITKGYTWVIEKKAETQKPGDTNNYYGGGSVSGGAGGSSDDKKDDTQTDTKPDETTDETTKPNETKVETSTVTNAAGKEVVVTKTTTTDATGAVKSVTEKSVIAASSATTSTTVTVKKDATGAITSATASIAKKVVLGNKATISSSIVSQIVEAAGTKDVKITMTVKNAKGSTKYKVKVDAADLKAGEDLYLYKLNTATGEYTMVNAKTYEVTKSGSVAVSISKKATYELVTATEAAQINKQIKSTIKPKKSSASVKKGKTTKFTLSSKANADNIKSITYTTSKKSVAVVSKTGKITAKGKGTATIKAKVTLKNGETKTIKMTIKVK